MTVSENNPIVRYHARVVGGWRVVIPEVTRKVLGLNRGDVVKVKVSKILSPANRETKEPFKIGPSVVFKATLGKNGLITIPEEARKALELNVGDYTEVELLDYYRVGVGEVSVLKFI